MIVKAVSFVAALALGIAPGIVGAQDHTIAIHAARLFDGEQMIDDARLVFQDGRVIAAGPAASTPAPPDAQVMDLSDQIIVPGLIAAHSHVGMVSGVEQGGRFYTREIVARDLAQFQRFGVVAVNALGLNAPLFHDLRKEFRGPDHGGADLYGAGPGVGVEGGAPPRSMNPLPEQAARPLTARDARAAVARMAASGVDMIKVWVDDLNGSVPKMAPEVYAAAIDAAHRHGLVVAAHIHDLEDAKGVAAAGVDIIAHGVRDRPVDQELIDALLANGIWYVPTININEAEFIYAENPQWLDDPMFRMALNPDLEARLRDPEWRAEALAGAERPRRQAAMNVENLRRLHKAGVRVAMGTDSGAAPLRIPGFAEHLEMERMVDAGMTPLEALRAATLGGADMMKLTDRGRLRAGARADFVVLDADPETDIRNTRSIKAVWRDGQPARMSEAARK